MPAKQSTFPIMVQQTTERTTISNKISNSHQPTLVKATYSHHISTNRNNLKKERPYSCWKSNPMEKSNLITKHWILSPPTTISLQVLSPQSASTAQARVSSSTNCCFQTKRVSKFSNTPTLAHREYGCGPIPSLINTSATISSLLVTFINNLTIDTEGLASLEKGQQNDIRIFTLATLISSYLIYNSVGCIDERSISDLQAVTKLSKNIMTEEQLSAEENQRRLQDFMPGFCWLVRDFTLQLKDQRGRAITPLQYLQKSLTDENSLVRASEQSKKIKKSLLSLFKDRDCVTLVRPARQQKEIQTLNKLPDVYLRRQFIDGVNVLREKIQRKAGSKMFQGKQLYGNDMACMIEAYAEAINQGRVPTIKSAWQQIVENEGDMAYAAGHQKYSQLFQNYFSDDQPKQQRQLNKILSRMKQQAIDEFKRNCVSQNDQFSRKLRQWIEKQEQTIREANENAINAHNLEILKEESHGLMRKVQQNYYVGKKQQYFDDLDLVLKNYRQKATGDKKQALLVDFLTATQKIGVNLQKKPQTSYENNQLLVKQTQQIMRMKEQANKSRANQANTTATITKKQEVSKQKRTEIKKKKVQQAGCCGGKCQIM